VLSGFNEENQVCELGAWLTKINPKTIAGAKTQKSHGIELNDASLRLPGKLD
jgi:hypothetical protein